MRTEPRSGYRFVIETLIIGMMICFGMVWVAPGPLFPLIMEEYSVGRASISWTTSIVSLIMAACAIPAGIIANKIGLKKTFAIGAFFVAAGIATPFCGNIFQLLLTRVAFAIGAAMTFPIVGGLVMQWFRGRETPLINGLNSSATGEIGRAHV